MQIGPANHPRRPWQRGAAAHSHVSRETKSTARRLQQFDAAGRCAFANRAWKTQRRRRRAGPLPGSRLASKCELRLHSWKGFSARFLTEVNPQSDNRGQEQEAEDDIEGMLN